MDNAKMKIVWMISQNGDRSFWTKIGVGHVNRDGSVNLVLEAIPVGAHKLQLRDYTPRDAEPREGPPGAPRATRDEAPREARGDARGGDSHSDSRSPSRGDSHGDSRGEGRAEALQEASP